MFKCVLAMLPMVQTEPVLFNCGIHTVNVAASPPATLPPSLTPESDVDELVDIFFDVDVTVNALQRIESCDLQLGDTWRGMQGKMSVTAPVKKIRKKSDNKPQAQINKCHNEKRRRELENETINQLEELLSTCLAEVKQPDKNGIVRETTRKIQEILRRRRECPDECPLRACSLSPVQAGEVSSTQPSSVGLHYSEIASIIEALTHYTSKLGWVLLELNSKAEIECITENIKELIQQDRTELYHKSIFSILHVKDHENFRPLLKHTPNLSWGSGEIDKFQAVKIRLIIKNPPNGTDSAGYAECVIHAAPARSSTSEEAGSVMCVIRRYEDASAALLPGDGGPPAITSKQSGHIVFRLDCNSIILFSDLSGININNFIPLVGTRYLELVESSDRIRVAAHLQKAACLPAPPAISEPFRLRISADTPCLKVIAQSRLFRANPTSGEPDFIMSTHTVLSDEDMDMLESEGPRPTIGGPLMTSVANGESASCDLRYRSPVSPNDAPFLNDFDLEPWPLLGDMSSEEAKERKENPSEGPSQPMTPHAPSTPGEGPPSNQPVEESNRLRLLLSKKPLPGNEGAPNSNNILKDLLKQEDEEGTSSETSAPHTPHTPGTAQSPLQAAAHARPQLAYAHALHAMQHQHASNSLLAILNDKSDEDGEENRRNSSEANRSTSQTSVLSQLLSTSNGPSGNGRSQDSNENYLSKFGMKRKYEDSKGLVNNAKRATPENQQVTSSAHSTATSPACSTVASSPASSSSASSMSDLCQKNRILVSLLARQQTPLPTPPPVLRAYPPPAHPPPAHPPPAHPPPPPRAPLPARHLASTLSNILTGPPNHRVNNVNGGMSTVSTVANVECVSTMSSVQSHLQQVLQRGPGGMYPSNNANSASIHYGTPAPLHVYSNQTPSGSNRTQGGNDADAEIPSDHVLSALLDEFIAEMPDADRTAPDANVRQRQGTKEKTAMINAIRQSLMQCETAGKSSAASPGAPPAYSVQSPSSPGAARTASPADGDARERWRAAAAPYAPDPARTRALAEQHRARLLQMQRSQHIMVPPEAAEQPQADLGSALVSGTAPPNVTLTRTDYHLYHTNQIGGNYGAKITTSQQNPMLSRQLSVAGPGAYAHAGGAAAALHTPASPQYHRAPRPHLVGGYYEEAGAAGGYCVDYSRCGPLPPHAPLDHQHACGAGTSEYVRNELRAVVGARAARPDLHPLQPPDMDQLMSYDMPASEYYGGGLGGGGAGGGR